jgi:hypothetical protein
MNYKLSKEIISIAPNDYNSKIGANNKYLLKNK